MTKIDTEELYAFNQLLKESKEGLDLKFKQSDLAIAGFSKEDKLTGGAWSSAKNHFDKGYTPLIDSFDSALVLLVDKFSDYTTEFRQQVTGGSVVLDTDQLQDLEIRMQNLASYKVQWLLDMADQLAGIPGIGKFFDEVSLNSTKKEVILLRKFQEFEHSHRNEFDEIAEALHFLRIGLEAVGNKKNFQGATKGFGPIDFNKDSWASNLSKFNERNKDKVDFIKESDAMAAGAVAEQTAQIHNAQMNLNQMGDAIMNEVNRSNSPLYNPLGGKTWPRPEEYNVSRKYKGVNLKSPIDEILSVATPGEQTRGKTTQWIKGGDFTTALKDFKNLGITNIVEIQTTYGIGYVGILPDGRKIMVRPGSSAVLNYPTLEIINFDKTKIKIRYDK
ncbi:T7SS effector LXG polymorphic toxin [Carnobacterium maltaromaticum]|uniref:T7SS effector LXG polymorphic toxin n=1 Tax=Carnobacterium maltaromaticum TaxID=2751 RepID=UPI0012F93132|nr:T7SS effector LXG polymorphic toxin [Carnobacterium maltaromaticum]